MDDQGNDKSGDGAEDGGEGDGPRRDKQQRTRPGEQGKQDLLQQECPKGGDFGGEGPAKDDADGPGGEGAEPDDGQGEWRVSGLDAAPEYRMSGRQDGERRGEGPQGGAEGKAGGQGGDYPGRREIHGFRGGPQEGQGPRPGGAPGGGGYFGGKDGERRGGEGQGGRDDGRGRGGGWGGRDDRRGRGGGWGGGGRDRGRGGGGGWGGRDDRRGGGGGWGGRDRGRVGGGGWARREGEGTPGRSEGADGRPAPPEHVDREIVLPGDVLDFGRFKPGPGAYADGETVYAACLGIKTVRGDQMGVIPISGKYMPRVGDIVVGKVMEMTPGAWIIDLNSPYVAPLPGSETPWTVEFGETTKYMALGDTVIVQIKDVNEIGRVGVTMLGPDLRKVVGGQTMDVDATKVPRLIGRGGSMIGLLKRLTRCRILVGQNGRVWLDGTVEDVTVAMGAIRMIEQNAHRLGLTDAVANFIQGMRNKMDAGRAERERKNEAAEERAIINDRVQRTAESKDVQKVDDSNGVQRMDKMENEEE